MIKVLSNELNTTSAPWPFAARGMDVIGLIKPTASNGHRFILVVINYFTKWVEAASYKAVTNNAANLNSDLIKAMCETFKIKHKLYSIQASNEWRCGSCQQKHQEDTKEDVKVEIPSLRIIQEAELSDAE
ncbi:uncharacterized protein [Nicotiana sylvestris]|uniref:uncharacterized protein n=1 Tax=Nicotiana sylvestris TaxID=4096 RepID=UPI00388C72B4